MLKKILSFILIFSLLTSSNGLVMSVFAQEAPSAPSAPSAPGAPEAPTAPPAPSAPTPPPASHAPDPTTTPSAITPTPTESVAPSGSPSPEPSSEVIASPTPSPENNLVESSDPLVNDPYNTQTGANSANTATENTDNNVNVNNNNNAAVTNQIDMNVSTGSNAANYNTMGGDVKSGNSYANLNVANYLNSNFTGVGGIQTFNIYDNHYGDIKFDIASGNVTTSFLNGQADTYMTANTKVVENSLTGANSDNSSSSNETNNTNLSNNNNVDLVNNIKINSDTGNNQAAYNTGSGAVSTGDANATANVVNLANNNFNVAGWVIGVVNIFGNFIGNIILPRDDTTANANSSSNTNLSNSQTGANSTNNSNLTNSNSENFSNYNNADVLNNVDANATTGNNTASFNTGSSNVNNGSSDVKVKESTVANQNVNAEGETVWIVIVNKLGQWFGYIVGSPENATSASGGGVYLGGDSSGQNSNVSNSQTGTNSSNNSNLTNSNSENVSNSNNAKIINNIEVVSNTGNNSSSYNTGGGNVSSGNASVSVNIANFINNNIVAKKFAVLLVNVFGSWTGNVIPPDQEIPSATTGENSGENAQTPSGASENSNQSETTIVTYGSSQEITVIENHSGSQTQNEEKKTIIFGLNGNFTSFDGFSEGTSRELLRGFYASDYFLKNIEDQKTGFSIPRLFNGKNVVDIRWLIISLSLWGIITLLRRYPSQIAYRIKYLYQFFLEVML